MVSSQNVEKICLFEKDRESSFKKWPYSSSSSCNVQKMAEAGFCWHGDDSEIDTAICFVCGKVLDGWEETDEPWVEHKKHAPQCLFVKYGRPEAQLMCEEMINLLEAILKSRIHNQYSSLKSCLQAHFEKKRREMMQQLSKH
ncbi:baculoviral IAP repeat-containing protein 5-like [Malaya genurostris]|uniref:baculoviral IAP repeat-containing protein 5-like n=1 Tax=Malaya genurostris TaxID=325434 RepID=UPI0026F406E7|nr:baculoviral IAP repeat-containing protein 5-like [Malaya genurostris]XP_058444906.1 baculoviral IAP repeat-containing protein 5-like [Malaya genurostris]